MTDVPLDIFFAFTMLGGVATMLLGLLVLRLTLTRRLKKKLKPTGDYWDSGTIDFGFINTSLFAWACAIPRVQRLERFQSIYPGLDVRSFANWFERAIAYGAIYGLIVMMLGIPFFYLFES